LAREMGAELAWIESAHGTCFRLDFQTRQEAAA
jgi:hypothetical protein